MSFKEPTSIAMLCSQKFFAYWQERWEKWGTKNNVQGAFWERLRNENNYCRPALIEEWGSRHPNKSDLVTGGTGGRYKAINFQSFETHKTVEFRLLPMFQKGNLAVSAIEQLVDIVETYLQTAELNTDVSSPATKFPTSKDEAVEMEPVVMDFDVPVTQYEPVTGEFEMLTEKLQMGDLGDGRVRMLRCQIAAYYQEMANSAAEQSVKLADPKKHKVAFDTFDPNPRARVR